MISYQSTIRTIKLCLCFLGQFDLCALLPVTMERLFLLPKRPILTTGALESNPSCFLKDLISVVMHRSFIFILSQDPLPVRGTPRLCCSTGPSIWHTTRRMKMEHEKVSACSGFASCLYYHSK